MIRSSTLDALCREAGLEPTRVAYAKVEPHEVTFIVYSVNIYGEKMVNADRSGVVTHWVKSKVVWP